MEQYNYGDRIGDCVYVCSPEAGLRNTGSWLNVKTGYFTPDPLLSVRREVSTSDIRNTKKKPEFVNLIRYVRPHNEFGEIDNMEGSTFVIRLDYRNKNIIFAYSVCSGDNFCKDEGVERAKYRFDSGSVITIPMYNGKIGDGGVLLDIFHHARAYLIPRTIKHFKMAGY